MESDTYISNLRSQLWVRQKIVTPHLVLNDRAKKVGNLSLESLELLGVGFKKPFFLLAANAPYIVFHDNNATVYNISLLNAIDFIPFLEETPITRNSVYLQKRTRYY